MADHAYDQGEAEHSTVTARTCQAIWQRTNNNVGYAARFQTFKAPAEVELV